MHSRRIGNWPTKRTSSHAHNGSQEFKVIGSLRHNVQYGHNSIDLSLSRILTVYGWDVQKHGTTSTSTRIVRKYQHFVRSDNRCLSTIQQHKQTANWLRDINEAVRFLLLLSHILKRIHIDSLIISDDQSDDNNYSICNNIVLPMGTYTKDGSTYYNMTVNRQNNIDD